jgi:hypothetical protein
VIAYRANAAQCTLLASKISNSASKRSLLKMAQVWLALAEQAERNREAPTLVYETPEPRQRVMQQQQQPQSKKK